MMSCSGRVGTLVFFIEYNSPGTKVLAGDPDVAYGAQANATARRLAVTRALAEVEG